MAQHSDRGPYAKSAMRKQQIVDRALEVFHELGADGTSLRSIADALGVTHPVLKHHFGSREQLFLEVLRQADARAREQLANEESESPAGFAAAMADLSLHQPGLMALYNAMIARALERDNAYSREYFVERYREMRADVTGILRAGREAGVVREDVPLETTAALVIAASDGLSTQWLLDDRVNMLDGMRLLGELLLPPGASSVGTA
ncbi:TetR/AcrR family transcriptional regulator [Agromyces silvae]|uniref:TetR/AcrR family transcriptional regulator n=1 Tax=Agromyces silvae TaxID=3388266 RepID=UPI00280C252E|nr:TetR/AcrR family transcriptional regulator [Agromyces protaetiae]